MARRSSLLLLILLSLSAVFLIDARPISTRTLLQAPDHLIAANDLIEWLPPVVNNVKNPNGFNTYGSPGTAAIAWPDPSLQIQLVTANTQCSSFITLLMKHVYGYTDNQFRDSFDSSSPNASTYYSKTASGQNAHITLLPTVASLVPGDLIVMAYNPDLGLSSSGHSMLVQSTPTFHVVSDTKQYFITNAVQPAPDYIQEITGYYDIEVIDSSSSYHGSTDTRAAQSGGIGRNGVFRLYVRLDGTVTGYTWSTVKSSTYYRNVGWDVDPQARKVALGRWVV